MTAVAPRARSPMSAPIVAYCVIFLFFAGPLLWLVSLSIRTRAEVFVSDIRLIPNDPTLENYVGVLDNPLFPDLPLERAEARGRRAPFGAMLFATPAAYALSRFRFRIAQALDDRAPRLSR